MESGCRQLSVKNRLYNLTTFCSFVFHDIKNVKKIWQFCFVNRCVLKQLLTVNIESSILNVKAPLCICIISFCISKPPRFRELIYKPKIWSVLDMLNLRKLKMSLCIWKLRTFEYVNICLYFDIHFFHDKITLRLYFLIF